jgi:signal transduction histidine kinase
MNLRTIPYLQYLPKAATPRTKFYFSVVWVVLAFVAAYFTQTWYTLYWLALVGILFTENYFTDWIEDVEEDKNRHFWFGLLSFICMIWVPHVVIGLIQAAYIVWSWLHMLSCYRAFKASKKKRA